MKILLFGCVSMNNQECKIMLECVSINNQGCKISSEIINVNTNELVFYPYSITINKCKGSCNTINDPYAKLCVSDTTKNMKYLSI